MNRAFRELYRSDTSTIGAHGNLLILVAHDAPRERDMDAMRDHGMALAERWPAGVGIMLIIRTSVKPPELEIRKRIVAFFKLMAPRTRAAAWVVTGRGFLAAAARSVIAAFGLGSRASFANKVFSEVPPALDWLTSNDHVKVDQAGASATIKELLSDEAGAS